MDSNETTTHIDSGRLYEDADKLLRLAETLQEKCESLERRRLVKRPGPGSSSGGRRPDMLAFNSGY